MSEVFNGDPKNDEAMARELLGDDDLFYIYQRAIDTYGKEMIARMHNMPVDQVKRGVYRRTKNGAVLIDSDTGEDVCREDSTQKTARNPKQPTSNNSSDAEGYYERGKKHHLAGNSNGALADLDECIRLNPSHADALIRRGMIRAKKGELDEALKDMTKAIRLKPEDAVLRCNRGVVWYKKGKKDEALNDLNEAIRLKPDFAEALRKRGALLEEKGKHVRALMDHDRVAILKRGDPDSRSQKSSGERTGKRRQQANDTPQTADEYYERGKRRYLADNIGGALADLDECIRLKPDKLAALTNRASIRAKVGKLDGAIDDYTAAIRIKPEDASLWYNRSVARSSKGQSFEAIDDLTEVIRLKPDFVEAWFNRGSIRGEKGEYLKAVADFDEVLRLRPNLQIAQRHRAQALLMIEKQRPVAMERQPVDSSKLVSVGYDKSSQILDIEFPRNRVYRYKNVPESVYNDLMRAPSKSDFFDEKIKGVYAYSRIS